MLEKFILQNETSWGRMQATLCSEYQLVAKSKLQQNIAYSDVIDLKSILFDIFKMMIGLLLSILGLFMLRRLFGLIKSFTDHKSSSMNIPQYLVGAKIKIALMALLLISCLCLFTQLCMRSLWNYLVFTNGKSFQKQVHKTTCLFLDFPQQFYRRGNQNDIQQLYNNSVYHFQLRKNQILLRDIKTSVKKLQRLINQTINTIQDIPDSYIAVRKQCFQLYNVTDSLSHFLSQAREIIYYIQFSLASLLFRNVIRWFIIQMPIIMTAVVPRVTIYCLLLIVVLIPILFKPKLVKIRYNWFFRLVLLSIFFLPFCILLNSIFNSIVIPVSSSFCRIIQQNGYNNILNNFMIDPVMKNTLQQFIGKTQYKSEGNLINAFDRNTIRVYQEFLANTTKLKQKNGQNRIQSILPSMYTQIIAEQQKIRTLITMMVQNTNSPDNVLNKFSIRVIGEYIENLGDQMCKSNLEIWSRMAWRQFWIAINIIIIIACFGLSLLRIKKQEQTKIYKNIELQQTSISARELK